MATRYTRRINLYINGKEVRNDIGSISKAMRKLQNEQRTMNRGSMEYQAHTKKIKYLSGIIAKHRNDLRTTGSVWSRMGDATNKYMGLAMGVVAAFAGVFAIMKKFKGVIDEFEESIT
jgi:saccharopine dehydrogenase-like NADP-dependent oxidoreductase